MSISELEQNPYQAVESTHDYRAISKAAVASVVFAILGIFAIWASVFAILPFLGICFGLIARYHLKKFPDELVGATPALVGLLASLLLFVTSISWHSFVFATEVPEGYQRISFSELKPKPRVSNLPFSPQARDFDGKKVFLKGYVRPGTKQRNLKQFILVGDFGQCCFGGNPKPTDVVAVDIVIDQTVNYGLGLRKLGGTFRLHPNPVAVGEKDVPGVYYRLEADFVQ